MKKSFKKLLAMLVTSIIMVTTLGMSVWAADLSKEVLKEADVYAPATTFEFTIAEGSAQGPILAGISEGLLFANGTKTVTMTSAPSATTLASTSYIVDTEGFVLDLTKFNDPGTYRYTVQETAGSYNGITYDDQVYTYDITLVDNGSGLALAGSVITDEDGSKVGGGPTTGDLTSIKITNLYGVDESGDPDPANPTSTLTVTKAVAGDQGETNKAFTFTIKIDGEAGEQYKMMIGSTETTLVSGTAATFQLKHGESAVITGLSATDVYTVSENDYTTEGYVTTVAGNETGSITANTTVAYTNTKNAPPLTGVIANIAPYLLLAALAVAMGLVFLDKKKKSEI